MKDLTGQRFGRLTAIEPTDRRVDQLVVWRCRCDCGNEVEAVSSLLIKGNTRSCGCLRRESRRVDIAGRRFGRLVAVEPTEKRLRGSVVWRCACDCGNECEVSAGMLNSGQARSCGCLRSESSTRDLAGKRFGRLVAVRPVGKRSRYVLWECRCDCGNVCHATTNLLTSGKKKSCGCLRSNRKQRAGGGTAESDVSAAAAAPSKYSRKDLAGQRFGKLTVIAPVGRKNRYVLWECACDCGNTTQATTNQLTSGTVRSCGCLRSSMRVEDLAGQRFGDLVALEPTDRRDSGSVVWHCKCDCGNDCYMSAARLKRLKHPTCGNH